MNIFYNPNDLLLGLIKSNFMQNKRIMIVKNICSNNLVKS